MMTSSEIKTWVKNYLETVVSPLLIADPDLTDFGEYLDETISVADSRTLAVYLAQGDNDETRVSETFIIQAQLARELAPDPYHDIIKKAIIDISASDVEMVTKAFTWHLWYPGEVSEGGSTSFIYYELSFTGELDDCE